MLWPNDPAESTIAGNVGIGLVPSNSDGVVSSSVTGGGGFAIASTSEHPDYAWKLIENVCEPRGFIPVCRARFQRASD